jgi:hypothetical protein
MKENSGFHKQFLQFSLNNLKIYKFQVGLLLAAFLSYNIMIHFLFPLYIGDLINALLVKKSTHIASQLAVMGAVLFLAKVILYTSDYFIKKHLGGLTKDFKRNLIKFMITGGKNLNGEESRIEAVVDNTVSVFFRSLVQLAPSVTVFIIIFDYFLVGSPLYSVFICGYIVYTIVIKRRIQRNMIVKDKKRYLQQSNTADYYMEKNRFQGNEDNVGDSWADFFKDVEVDSLSNFPGNSENTQIAKNNICKNHRLTVVDYFKRMINPREMYFVLANCVIFIFFDMRDTTFGNVLLLLFFTFRTIMLVKIVINTHYLNVKNINSIKKQLNFIGNI